MGDQEFEQIVPDKSKKETQSQFLDPMAAAGGAKEVKSILKNRSEPQ